MTLHKNKITQLACSVILIGMLFGCQTQDGTAISKLDVAPEAGLKLHKPKSFPTGLDRLIEMNGSLLSEQPFPEPIEIDYVEVVHGSGPGGHSHFYLASTYDKNSEGDDHGGHGGHFEEDETVKRLVAKIPLRTELTDIVKWLPGLAAKSNTSEAEYTTVSDASKSLTGIIEAIPEDTSNDDFRNTWKQHSKEIEPLLIKLQTLATKSTGEIE